MTKISDERLQEMLKASQAVTPGPWLHSRSANRPVDGQSYEIGSPTRGVAGMMYGGDAAYVKLCDPDTIRSILTELQSLRHLDKEQESGHIQHGVSQSSPQPAGVRVKGLGWRNLLFPVDCEAAKTPYGDYRVGPDEKVNGFYGLFDGEVRRGLYDDRDEAKAAAEADYRQRILSALETQEEEPWGYHNAMGQVFRSDELALQDEHVRSRFTEPLYTHPTPVQKEGEGQTVSDLLLRTQLALIGWVNVAEMLADEPGMEAHFHDIADATQDELAVARAALVKP